MDIEVTSTPGATTGRLRFAGQEFECALGRAGILAVKREGDGGTPKGRFALRELRYRVDRMTRPNTGLSAIPIEQQDGWCDAPGDPAYNRLIRFPYPASAEHLWRDDGLYDVVVMLGYNDDPVVPGAGSAIFLHLAKLDGQNLGSTEGCVALRLPNMRLLLEACGPDTFMNISYEK